MSFTVEELAKELEVPTATCRGFVAFLEKKGLVYRNGSIKKPGKRGRGTLIFHPKNGVVDLSTVVEALERLAAMED